MSPAESPNPVPGAREARAALERLFAACERAGASDLHLSADAPARLRVQGRLAAPEGEPALPASLVHAVGLRLAATSLPAGEPAEEALLRAGAVDGAVTSPGGSRYRFNVFREQGRTAVAMRRVSSSSKPARVPSASTELTTISPAPRSAARRAHSTASIPVNSRKPRVVIS